MPYLRTSYYDLNSSGNPEMFPKSFKREASISQSIPCGNDASTTDQHAGAILLIGQYYPLSFSEKMPLMATPQTNPSPDLTWRLVWTITAKWVGLLPPKQLHYLSPNPTNSFRPVIQTEEKRLFYSDWILAIHSWLTRSCWKTKKKQVFVFHTTTRYLKHTFHYTIQTWLMWEKISFK